MISLHHKLAIITGGNRGIGAAITHLLAATHRCSTLVLSPSQDPNGLVPFLARLQATHATTTAACPAPAPVHGTLGADVADPATWASLVKELAGRGLAVQLLVNAAGVAQRSLLAKTADDDIAAILDVNLKGAVLGCKHVGRHMMRRPRREREDGRCSIINVASVMATRGGTGASVYAASKAGLLGLTSALSQELGPFGIRVNALVPGYIETRMTENLDRSNLSKQIPLGRMGKAEEVADAAAFLATNPYANNCVLTLDGGLSAAFKAP